MAISLKPKSTAKSISSDRCLCHKDGVQGKLTSFTDVSWKTFKAAANLRHDQIADNMSENWEDGPFGSYHRNCYQSYTAKNLLERVEKRRKLEEQSLPKDTKSAIYSICCKKCAICWDEKIDPIEKSKRKIDTL